MPTPLGSTSRSPSPSPSPSPQPQPIPIPAVLQPHAGQPHHPLPPIPIHLQPNFAPPTQPSLALPPPAPQGPRSPGLVLHRSHTPSPERGGLARSSIYGTITSPAHSEAALNGGAGKPALGIHTSRRDEDDVDVHDDKEKEETRTPIRPSAKALGKRRVVEIEEPDRKSKQFRSEKIWVVDVRGDAQQMRSTLMNFSMSVQTLAMR